MSRKHRNKKRKLRRKGGVNRGINRHHLVNKTNGGSGAVQNLLRIYIFRHQAWHFMFKNMDLDQAIGFLKRVKRAKANQGRYE